jgi:hypothetical protein
MRLRPAESEQSLPIKQVNNMLCKFMGNFTRWLLAKHSSNLRIQSVMP